MKWSMITQKVPPISEVVSKPLGPRPLSRASVPAVSPPDINSLYLSFFFLRRSNTVS